jgi:hypothetical protein
VLRHDAKTELGAVMNGDDRRDRSAKDIPSSFRACGQWCRLVGKMPRGRAEIRVAMGEHTGVCALFSRLPNGSEKLKVDQCNSPPLRRCGGAAF